MLSLLLALLAAQGSNEGGPTELKPFEPLVGRCWRAAMPDGKAVDTHCYERVYGGQHVRDRHVVSSGGKTVYEGETLYSVEQGEVRFTYWNSLGGVGRGTALLAHDSWRFTGAIRSTPEAASQPIASTWRIRGSGYEVRNSADGTPLLFTPVK